ncbi:MAG: hypothetical protein JW810_05555, partial [Sedimentisphaerales bacterium]|nr:hypothetical protein [Sedimentisphaerales bacterium]
CYFLGTAGPDNGLGTPLTDSQMKQQGSFVGWDFAGETTNGISSWWIIHPGQYPALYYFDPTFAPYEFAGQGTGQSPYLISEPNALAAIWQRPGCHFRLQDDVDLAGITWSLAVIPDFTGVFDGNGHTVHNLTIDPAGEYISYLGLFGRIWGSSAEVKNLVLENVHITGGSRLGGLCGENGGSVSNCYSTGFVTGWYRLGGLCGRNSGSIDNCYSTVSVNGGFYLGGLCGMNYDNGSISNCYSTGSVTGVYKSQCLGGLCGWNEYGSINNCYATGSVTGGDESRYLGGLCGWINESNISNCYSTGSVTSGSESLYLGGLCGTVYNSTVSDGYFLSPASGGGPINGIGEPLSDIQMRQQASFIGWDFVGDGNGTQDHWQMCIDGLDYPRLAWQFSISGDLINPGRVDNYDLYVLTNDWLSISSRCGDIAPPESPDGLVNLLDYVEFSRHWLDVSLFGANQVHHLLPSLWTPPQLMLAWNANPRILTPYVTADKLTMYYSRYHDDQWQILQTSRDNPAAPFPVGQVITELTGGFTPWLSTDGLRMYYTMDIAGDRVMQLAERADTGSPWQHVRALTEIHAAGSDDNRPSLTADELTLFWASSRSVGSGIATSLWTAKRNSISEPFGNAVNLSELNLYANNSMPCIMPDGLTIYFLSCNTHPDQFYKATRISTQEPFGNIQALQLFDGSPFDGHAPFVTSDEQELYFYSEWMGVGEGICVSHYQP